MIIVKRVPLWATNPWPLAILTTTIYSRELVNSPPLMYPPLPLSLLLSPPKSISLKSPKEVLSTNTLEHLLPSVTASVGGNRMATRILLMLLQSVVVCEMEALIKFVFHVLFYKRQAGEVGFVQDDRLIFPVFFLS